MQVSAAEVEIFFVHEKKKYFDIGCKIHFYMLFDMKFVLAVCVHNHPIMIIIHPVFLLNPNKALAVSQIKLFTDSRQRDVVLHSFSYRRREHMFF